MTNNVLHNIQCQMVAREFNKNYDNFSKVEHFRTTGISHLIYQS